MKKICVAYFSAGRETRFAAKDLAEMLQADLYEIKPETPYTEADLDWADSSSRTSLEMADPSCRPALLEAKTDLSAYDLIFLGFPVWWDSIPRIIASFLEANDFKGKTVIPFGTSLGGGMGSSSEDIQAILGDDTRVTEGMLLNGKFGKFKIESWLVSLGITL